MSQTPSAADEFFARYTNPTPDTIARLQQEAHPDGDIDAIVAEADHYWNRVTSRRAEHLRAVTTYTDPFAHRNENARRPYASLEALAMLPAPANAKRSLEERYADDIRGRRFWQALISKPEYRNLIEAKARRAQQRATEARQRAARAAAARNALEHRNAKRAAKRQQRLDATLQRIAAIHAARAAAEQRRRERRLRAEIHPAGITLERALEIALALTPPQEPH